MMRHLILYLIMVLTPTPLFSQTLEERIADKLCDCFTTIDQSPGEEYVFTKFKDDCLAQALKIIEAEKNSMMDTIDDGTDYQRGLEFGRKIGIKAQAIMIQRCDLFFQHMDNVRNDIFRNVSIDQENAKISSKTILIATDPSVANYFDRALSYMRIKDFKRAKKDLDKIIKLDGNFGAGYLLRGLLYEQKGAYKKAIQDYENGKRLTRKDEVDMLIALAQRKRAEKR